MLEPRHISEIIQEVLPSLMSIQGKGKSQTQTQGEMILSKLKNEIKRRGLHTGIRRSGEAIHSKQLI